MQMDKTINSLTVIIPAYNEEKGIGKVLTQLVAKASECGWNIIVVNDASSDNTAEVVAKFTPSVRLINHRQNLGYGASIKTGIRNSSAEWIATFDADGQHRLEDLEKLTRVTRNFDAVIGIRDSSSKVVMTRFLGKFLLKHVSNLIIGCKLRDINCGLRLIKRKTIVDILGFTCDRFSFSTTSTIALISMGYYINFVEVTVDKRVGKSTVKQHNDGLETIMLVLRLMILFNPMRIFLLIAFLLIGTGVIYQLFELFVQGFSMGKLALLLITSGLVCFFFALQQDQISYLRSKIASFKTDFKEDSINFIERNDSK
ncbi:MAG: glycosyltransferase family 2 protein [Candidatus Omnitrophota bacterium]